MAQRFPGLLDDARIRRVRTMYDFDDVVTSPLHGFAGATDYWRRASSKPWLASVAVPTLVLNARNDPFVPAESLPGAQDVSRDVLLRAAGARRSRRIPDRTLSRPSRLAAAPPVRLLPASPVTDPTPAYPPFHLTASDDTSPRNLQGLRHPRRRRQDAHAGHRPLGRPGARLARPGARPRHVRRRPRRPAVGSGARGRRRRRHPRRRRERHRRRHGRHADDVFRRIPSRHAVERHGDRQPQSARLQRPQDGRRRRHAVRRRHPGAARAHRSRPPRHGRGHVSRRRHRTGVPRPHRRRHPARAADEDRRRLRQRRRRRVRADALPAPRLRGHRDVLRRRRHLSQSPSRSVATGEPRGPDRRCSPRASTTSASRSTATATASAWSRATATSSIRTGS